MKTILLFLSLILFANSASAAICKKNFFVPIKMDDGWYKKEEERIQNEDRLIEKNSENITKNIKPLVPEKYVCSRGETCDPIKNCQMEEDVKNINEVEYLIKIDSGIIISKSYCSVIGKCIGYNDFYHTQNVTASENRLIDIKKNNAVFYNYFYSANSKSYEPPFNILNFRTGSEIYLNDVPNFSPDERFFVQVKSIPGAEKMNNPDTGFDIRIYEANNNGEYKEVEPYEFDSTDPTKIISTFLSRNPACGETPYFHSWKNNKEIRLSMLPPRYANHGRKVILSYDEKAKKWGCKEDLFPEFKCKSYLPASTKFSSNLLEQQVNACN